MKKLQKILHYIKSSKYLLCLVSLFSLSLLLNLLAFNEDFCNGYTNTVYAVLSDFFGRSTNILPFSLGEIFMYVGGIFLLLSFSFALLLFPFKKSRGYARFTKIYFKSLPLVCTCFLLTYTLQWGIPFRSSLLGESGHFEKEYSTENLRALWLDTVNHLNEACRQVPRDEDGHIIFDTKENTEQKTIEAMKAISDRYPRLKGFYPTIKPALCSDVLRWMDIGGYTYPYTMEITYNKYITSLYFPSLYAHESAHHQGYYQENEANFLSYLACSGSSDPVLRYSAFHTIFFYIDDAYVSALSSPDIDKSLIEEYRNTRLDAQIALDEKEERKKVEKSYSSTSHPLQKYSDVAENAADVGWSTQSDVLKENGYDGVVQLLLEYYDTSSQTESFPTH
ncbi:MAG: DUF3810 family protein [Lachnospiraceae bacterium]|nr:DUF3810 family protein [Lachnospiraceae bacterium]